VVSWVELVRRYSNRPDHLDDLNQIMAQLDRERGLMPHPIEHWSHPQVAVTPGGYRSQHG
jgi:hypothetical protein